MKLFGFILSFCIIIVIIRNLYYYGSDLMEAEKTRHKVKLQGIFEAICREINLDGHVVGNRPADQTMAFDKNLEVFTVDSCVPFSSKLVSEQCGLDLAALVSHRLDTGPKIGEIRQQVDKALEGNIGKTPGNQFVACCRMRSGRCGIWT